MVSIIIAVYNGERFIDQTIISALNQTVPIEIIIVDDCSTDNSLLHIQYLMLKHKNIKIVRNSQNIGFCRSINRGIKKAVGEYLVVLGQDDILEPNHCEKMLNYFTKETCLVFCDYDLINEDGIVYDTKNHCKHSNKSIKDFYKENAIPSVGLMISKSKLENVGGYPENENFPHYGEYNTWIRLALVGNIIFCDRTRAKYRRHNNNLTNTFYDKTIVKKLNRYFVYSKKQLLKSKKVNYFDKCYILLYMLYRTIRVYLLGR